MLLGRAWCGIGCPDGTLTEWISRYGQNKSIPRWMRWPGWPLTMFISLTLYGQLIAAYDVYYGTLLLLGLPTLGAIACGYRYGNGRRLWCMYLCPANAPFSLLAKIAPLHFKVDGAQCRHARPPYPRVDCPTLINIRQMKSASDCHMCAQCSGYLDAVELAARPPDQEILQAPPKTVSTMDAMTLLFGLIGVLTMTLVRKNSSWFEALKSFLASTSLASLDRYVAPWWLLANHPAQGAVSTLLDGVSIALFIGGGAIVLGLILLVAVKLAVRLSDVAQLTWQRLSLALIPVGGAGIFTGLSLWTANLLARNSISLNWLSIPQQMLLGLGALLSCWLGTRLLITQRSMRQYMALLIFLLPVSVLVLFWTEKIWS